MEKYFFTNKRCLFVGKSINGWITNNKNVEELFDYTNTHRIVNRHDQMVWVSNLEGPNAKKYNTKKSAFWRIIKKISLEYFGEENWYNYIAWSNLYKLSPKEGNPNANLQNMQRETCIKILNEEIKVLQPNYVIFLTSGWESFYLQSIGVNKEKNKTIQWGNRYATYFQEKNNVVYIQSPHPQGKAAKPHIQAILEILR